LGGRYLIRRSGSAGDNLSGNGGTASGRLRVSGLTSDWLTDSGLGNSWLAHRGLASDLLTDSGLTSDWLTASRLVDRGTIRLRTGLSADLSGRHGGIHRRGDRCAHERRLARHHPRPSHSGGRGGGGRSRALQAGSGLGADTLLHLGGALGRAPRPLAQPLDLTRLGERKQ
jgi:hypothetical protein